MPDPLLIPDASAVDAAAAVYARSPTPTNRDALIVARDTAVAPLVAFAELQAEPLRSELLAELAPNSARAHWLTNTADPANRA